MGPPPKKSDPHPACLPGPRFTHLVDPAPRGFRRAIIILRGKDTKGWAGAYGVKFTSAELSFVPAQKKQAFEVPQVVPV